MSIVMTANDALHTILRDTARLLGTANAPTTAVTLVPNGSGRTSVRVVSIQPGVYTRLNFAIQSDTSVASDRITEAISDLLDGNTDHVPVFACQHLEGNRCRWVLWNPVTGKPQAVEGKEVAAEYRVV